MFLVLEIESLEEYNEYAISEVSTEIIEFLYRESMKFIYADFCRNVTLLFFEDGSEKPVHVFDLTSVDEIEDENQNLHLDTQDPDWRYFIRTFKIPAKSENLTSFLPQMTEIFS